MNARTNIIEYPEQQNVPQTPMAMLSVAVAKGMSPETIKGFMDLAERWEANEARRAYNEAFAAFKAEAIVITKNRNVDAGPLTGKRYAELISWVENVTPALSRNGLSASWKLTKDDPAWIEVTCTLKHVKGHSESVSMGGPPDTGGAKSPIQARASTVTYLERYTLKAITGLAEGGDDNDGGGTTGMTEEEVATWKKKIEATTTKEKAKEVWQESLKACEAVGDVAAAEALKAIVKAHNAFIDKAAKAQ